MQFFLVLMLMCLCLLCYHCCITKRGRRSVTYGVQNPMYGLRSGSMTEVMLEGSVETVYNAASERAAQGEYF